MPLSNQAAIRPSDKMGHRLRRAVPYFRIPAGIIALACLLLSGLVHVASIRGIDVESAWPTVWGLHYALFPMIVLAVIATGVAAGQTRLGFRGFLGLVPVPALIILAVIFVYALVNLLMLTPLSGVGDPVIRDGRFLFNDHGVVREMSEGQFHFQRSVSLRLFSSVWLFLYLSAAVYLLGARPSPNELER